MPGRFSYQPALDGVRAVAVALVLVFHGGFEWLTGGYVGVSVFFTLSGYLITSLALHEHAQTGSLDVQGFYARRVRRLLPASILCVGAVVGLAAAGLFAGVEHLRRDVWAAVVPVYNWVALAGGESYGELVAAAGDPASPLDHFWSLAIEEQFYWVWPLALVLILRLRPTGRLAVVAGLVVTTAVAAPVIHAVWGPDATYWATPARLGEIVVGALLAVLLERRRALGGLPDRLWWLAPAGLAAIVWAAATWPAGSGPAYSGWLPVFALASTALILGLQVGSPMRRLFSMRPLVFVGLISYGIYLFHWPIYAVLDGSRTGLDGLPLFALRVGVTLAVATVSFYVVERPIRRAARFGWRPVAAASLTAGVAVVALVIVLPTEHPPYWARLTTDEPTPSAARSDVPLALLAPPAPVPATSPASPATRLPAARPAETLVDTTVPATVLPALSRPVRILVLGDSTAAATGQGLLQWAAAHPGLAEVSVRWAPGFGFISHGERPGFDAGWATLGEELRRGLDGEIARLQPDVVMLMSTNADIEDRVFDDVGALAPPSAAFLDRMTKDYLAFVDELAAAGVSRVAWVVPSPPTIRWSAELAELAEPARRATLRRGIERVAARRAGIVSIADLAGWEARHEDRSRRPDGLHYSVEAATAIADQFLAPLLISTATS